MVWGWGRTLRGPRPSSTLSSAASARLLGASWARAEARQPVGLAKRPGLPLRPPPPTPAPSPELPRVPATFAPRDHTLPAPCRWHPPKASAPSAAPLPQGRAEAEGLVRARQAALRERDEAAGLFEAAVASLREAEQVT